MMFAYFNIVLFYSENLDLICPQLSCIFLFFLWFSVHDIIGIAKIFCFFMVS